MASQVENQVRLKGTVGYPSVTGTSSFSPSICKSVLSYHLNILAPSTSTLRTVYSRSSSAGSGTSHSLCKAPSLIPRVLVPHTYSRVHTGGGVGEMFILIYLSLGFALFPLCTKTHFIANGQHTKHHLLLSTAHKASNQ